jgi:hypothetical protein
MGQFRIRLRAHAEHLDIVERREIVRLMDSDSITICHYKL